ncbi:MAG: DUF3341 domain-containing protein, partial [Ignavibacteria bacterium]|nr:DUF3341 domain-containing protein [Ignavibacteria bacterium]
QRQKMKEKTIIEFADENDFLSALDFLKSETEIEFETISPIPLSISRKVGGNASRFISLMAVLGAILGFGLMAYFIWWTSAYDYKMNIGGKPFFSLISSLPIIFEITIFITLIFIIIGFLIGSKLPSWKDDDSDFSDSFIITLQNSSEELLNVLANFGGVEIR